MAEASADLRMAAYDILAARGKVSIIVHLLGAEKMRFSDLERAIANVPQRRLVRSLRELESDAILRRLVVSATPPHVEYSLTEWGRAVSPALEKLREWFESRP